ncbi:hypothetical protein VVMO6_04485 [Vibrio vulnificus MO6-24/O]|nr:hypothetical protein VVMO6_04485 [Vibrio vulnificus MO6-24/O]
MIFRGQICRAMRKKFSPENGLKSSFDLFEEVFFFLKGAE